MQFPQNLFFRVFYKAKAEIIQKYTLVRGLAHGDPVAVDFPDRLALQLGFLNLEYMIPASALQIEMIPVNADQLQTAEI